MVLMFLNVAAKIGEYLVAPVGRQVGYFIFYKDNIDNLNNHIQKLKDKRFGVQLLVDAAKNNGEIVGRDVEAWLTSVDRINEEAQQILEDRSKVEKGCCNGWCPDLESRYSLSRKAKKKTQVVVELHGNGNFNRVSYPTLPVGIASTSIASSSTRGCYKGFESRISTMTEIMKALEDDEISMIGICGMGGVGKTTLVKEVKTTARNENLFDEVAMTVVSKTPDLIKIQRELADMLGLSLVEENIQVRAKRLHSRLTNGNRILVILDDIWQTLDLMEIGIPSGGDNKRCKIVLTSRLQRVCSGMETQKDITVQVLSEKEAWGLFKEMAGNSVEMTDLNPTAKEVAKECGGLPIALVTVGKALKNREKHAWNDALRQLRRSNVTHIPGMHKNVYACIGLSYSHLESNQAKSLLLLCCIFPEDYDIPIEFLVRYGVGLWLFEDTETVAEARDRIYSLVDELRSCNLLLAGDDKFVQLHDVIRDVGISIATKGEHVYMVRQDAGLKSWPQKKTYEHYTAISLRSNEMHKLPAGLYCPQLELLQLLDNYTLLNIPGDFFGGMKELRVIGFYRITLESPGPSFHFLPNIRTLCLDFCKSLPDLSIIGSLKNLEILSFFNCCLDELPKEIGQLSNLKVLDLRCDKGPTILPPGVLSNLYKLEELYMGRNFWQWKTKESYKENASITELSSLSYLNTLTICISDPKLFPMDFCFEKLMRFNISIGSQVGLFSQYRLQNSLRLHKLDMCILLDTGINALLKRTEILSLEVKGLKTVLNELDEEGFVNLKSLSLSECKEVEYLIDTTNLVLDGAFVNLESLWLYQIDHLQEICNGSPPVGSFGSLQEVTLWALPVMKNLWWDSIQPECLGNLRVLQIIACDILKSVFSQSIVKGLMQLEKLEIISCDMMEEIVAKKGGDEESNRMVEFPNLKILNLSGLQNLRSFYPESEIIGSENYDNGTIQPLFNQKVAFPNLEKLSITGMINLDVIAHGRIPDASFGKVREITVAHCDRLLNAIPSNLVPCLRNLEKVLIDECASLLEVFEFKGRLEIDDGHSTKFSKKREMTSGCSLKLTNVEVKTLAFKNLREIIILQCGSLRNMFSTSMATGLLQLRMLKIGFCTMMEEIVAEQEGEESMDTIEFPQLCYLELLFLESLNIFCPANHDIDFPSLNRVVIQGCPKLKTFCSGQLSAPKLEKVEVNLSGSSVWKGDLNSTIEYLMQKRPKN